MQINFFFEFTIQYYCKLIIPSGHHFIIKDGESCLCSISSLELQVLRFKRCPFRAHSSRVQTKAEPSRDRVNGADTPTADNDGGRSGRGSNRREEAFAVFENERTGQSCTRFLYWKCMHACMVITRKLEESLNLYRTRLQTEWYHVT